MKNKKFRAVLSLVLAVIMAFSVVLTASAAEFNGKVKFSSANGEYQATKISHPDKNLGEIDGVVDYIGNSMVSAKDQGQGDRAQSYIWAAIAKGDWIYASTNYNSMMATLSFMDTVLGNDYDPTVMHSLLNVMFNGSFFIEEEDGGKPSGVLFKMNAKTGEVKILMSDPKGVQLRNVCEYNGKFYFCGSVYGLPKIVQVDPETDEVKIVYEGISGKDFYAAYQKGICSAIRGLCEYNGKLVVSMVTLEGSEILISDHPEDGQEAFTRIATQEDLFDYPAYCFPDSIYGGSIWEMVEFNDKLYVTMCTGRPDNKPDENSMQSFAIVVGEPKEDGTWSWRALAGDKENDGARYTFGIDPERTRAGAGVINVYGDYLYIGEYNDEEIALEDVIFKLDFDFVNANLEQSVNLYRMDKNENIELVVGNPTKMFPNGSLSGLKSGFGRNENQYIWRMTSYNGKLFVGTFDTSSLLQPIGQFVNKDLITMSRAEWRQLIGYIEKFLEASNAAQEEALAGAKMTKADKASLASLNYLFDNYSTNEIVSLATGEEEGDAKTEMSTEELLEKVKGLLKCASYLAKADRGFDLYVSEDGVNFKTITTNGLGDPTNHGLRVFANMDCGLMIGTANPFWAGQVWMMTDDGEIIEENKTILDTIKDCLANIWETICGIFTTISVVFANFDLISETLTSVIGGLQNGTLFAG